MKYFMILLVVICSCSGDNNFALKQNNTTASTSSLNYSFNKIKINTEHKCSFTLTNTGNEPLSIYDIKTSCGCTSAEWDKSPLKPLNSKIITITHKDKYPGVFRKTITIYGNIKEPIKFIINGTLIE